MADVRERIYFDGWELTEGTVRNWEVRDGFDEVPSMLGDNLTVANRTGEVWRPKVTGPGRFTVKLWLAGNTIAEAQDAWRTLIRACVRPHRLVRVQRTLASGEVVYCSAEVVGGIQPTHLGQLGYQAAVTFNVPEGVWYSDLLYTYETPAGSALPKTLALPGLAASTAVMENLEFTITGRITNAKIIDVTDGGVGDTLTYNTTLASGAWIKFSAYNWGVAASFAYANNNIVPTGRRLMTITAARPGEVPTVRLEGTNGDASTRLKVYGRRVYLC